MLEMVICLSRGRNSGGEGDVVARGVVDVAHLARFGSSAGQLLLVMSRGESVGVGSRSIQPMGAQFQRMLLC